MIVCDRRAARTSRRWRQASGRRAPNAQVLSLHDHADATSPEIDGEILEPSSACSKEDQHVRARAVPLAGGAGGLVAAYDRELKDAPSAYRDQPQRTLHVFARGQDGAVVVDLWEREEDFRRMMDDPEFQRNLKAADWPSEPEVEIYEVHATMP
jgi:hypothetical protein